MALGKGKEVVIELPLPPLFLLAMTARKSKFYSDEGVTEMTGQGPRFKRINVGTKRNPIYKYVPNLSEADIRVIMMSGKFYWSEILALAKSENAPAVVRDLVYRVLKDHAAQEELGESIATYKPQREPES